MAKCPLCGTRTARRECPAKATRICSVCCGAKREIEIDCPGDCVHLRTGRAWEAGRQERPVAGSPQFSQQFVYRHAGAISALSQAIVEERDVLPALVDADVRKALEALRATLRTLEAGLYYETRPESDPLALSLYRRMKSVLDELMRPGTGLPALKVSEAATVLEFLISTHEFHSGERPRSRRYLDWLSTAMPRDARKEETGRLILP